MDFFDVRVFFRKQGDARFISHLDLSRFMQRALKRSRLPLWHTEGFNPHPYVTFALPLSLGQTGVCESLDFRLTRPIPMEEIARALSAVMPRDIIVLRAAEPWHKAKTIRQAVYDITLYDSEELLDKINFFFTLDSIVTKKTTKKGGTKGIDLKPLIAAHTVTATGGDVSLSLTLPAGGELNINPSLVIGALGVFCGSEFCPAAITRTKILTETGEEFE